MLTDPLLLLHLFILTFNFKLSGPLYSGWFIPPPFYLTFNIKLWSSIFQMVWMVYPLPLPLPYSHPIFLTFNFKLSGSLYSRWLGWFIPSPSPTPTPSSLLLTLSTGPLYSGWFGWLKYCKLLLEYLRKVSAVLRAKVHAQNTQITLSSFQTIL